MFGSEKLDFQISLGKNHFSRVIRNKRSHGEKRDKRCENGGNSHRQLVTRVLL